MLLLHLQKKGTDFILKIIQELRDEGFSFNFKIISGVQHAEVLKAISESDLLIDELYGHGPGVLGAEAMAAGCVVLTNYLIKYKDNFPAPVIPTTENNLKDNLKSLLQNREMIQELKARGREFVFQNNAPQKVVEYIINIINNRIEPNYKPTFYLEKFLLPENQELTLRNKKLTKDIIQRYTKNLDRYIINRLRNEGLSI